ncbi:RagB/SusD family nutrient uptake outer membrane protein [uncultured Chryseobacterium sp.]|jgi:SusD family.|uniref:RagB/SusD family nutrient uptake outer membrane protein n=1 Tax=uncultured Chryseobacterium sp. TaxID=259322 RepID=UPI0026369006|nr:RagB/SusD family nutrient uptake outer membrane protein [uncultured Chryseobacterium sp.]
MKRSIIYILTLGASVLAFNSCNDFLDREPIGVAIDGELPVGGMEEKVFGLYSKMRTQAGITNWTKYWFQSIRSDDAAKGSSATDAADIGAILDNFQYSKTHFMGNDNWNGHYSLIYDCNFVIETIKNQNLTDNASIINDAEARAIRAFCYFELRRDFGEIPLVLNIVNTPQDAIKAKSTITEVDAQIKSDLEFAAANLPISWPSYRGRATKGMANAYLAKLALYQQNWNDALTKAELVINSGIYQLEADYAKLFSEEGDDSKEVVWEVQFARIAGVNYSNNYWESQGVRGSGAWDLGWGFNVPTTNLINAYEPGDKRKDATILHEGSSDGYGLIVPTGLDQPNWNKKAYTNPAVRTSYGENKNHWTNIKLLRYSDVLLMAAEAALQTGDVTKATTYLNMVRTRAGLANTIATLAAIKQERRVEFGLEGERFYDLVRWGDATAVLGSLGYADKNKFYPIPQTAIDQAGGVLVQNPNY